MASPASAMHLRPGLRVGRPPPDRRPTGTASPRVAEPLDRRDPAWSQHIDPRSRSARPGRRMPAVPDLPETVAQLCPWRAPSALLLATEPYPVAVDALRRVGLGLTVIDPAEAAGRRSGLVDPINYVLVGSEVLAEPVSSRLLDEIRAAGPTARFLLLAGPEVAAPTLRAAIRAGIQEVLDPLDQIALLTGLRGQVDRAAFTRERVLAVGAHPDDVELGCAGALLEHRRRGDRLSVLTLSHGAVGGAARERSAEARAAAGSLGSQLLLADLPDTRISEGIETIAVIEQVVAALNPTVVYVHSPHDTHQDHRAVHAATMSAARSVPTLLAYQSPSALGGFMPTAFVPIDEVIEHKVDVLARYASQSARSYLDPDAVVSTARYWGRQAGPRATYAEPFEVLRSVA